MRIDKKRASTLFALTLLIASLLLVNMNGPSSAASPSTPSGTAPASIQENEFVWLHGPSLEPIHMNSNKTLTPVHMHFTGGLLEQTPPEGTWWHELSPDYCYYWLLTVCEDNGDGLFGPNDQINMTEEVSGTWTMYHVDRVTYTLMLSNLTDPADIMFVEVKYPPVWEPYMDPVCTLWHEVWPSYSNVYHCVNFTDQGTGMVDFCDFITLQDINTMVETDWHVEEVATDIILREKIIDPRCTWWHAIYPEEEFCKWYHLTSWEDNGDGMLSPTDQIDMIEEVSENKTWYFVDRLTVTLNVTDDEEFPTKWMKIELKSDFEEIYEVFKLPVGTLWHEVIPEYSNVYNLTMWDLLKDDNCNGVLDPCDWIWLQNITDGEPVGDPVPWHIADMTYDLILNKKIADPVCTDWHAIYPPHEFCNWYHVDDWEDTQPEGDPGYGLLSPCDNVVMDDGGIYHVENMTVTLMLSNLTDPADIMYVEAWPIPFEYMYWPKIYPVGEFYWHEVWPNFCTLYYTMNWTDNCNGVLDYCDKLSLRTVVGLEDSYWHVEEVAVDMVVQKVGALVHDVAVVEVFSEYAWVYQGEIDPIHVTVTNLGDYDEPSVTVYAFYDGNLAAPPKTTSLNIGQTKVLTFDWNTSGVPPGFYTVSANATIPVDDVPGNNYLQGNDQEVRERLPPPPLPLTADLELHPRMVIDIEDPTGTQWHELYTDRTRFYQTTDWTPGTVLSPEDTVYMNGTAFIVDDVTIDIEVFDEHTGITYWLDYECGYWTFDPEDPICTKWNQIKDSFTHMPPDPPRCWHLTEWIDNEDGRLSFCDSILMTPNDPYPGPPVLFHVEQVTVTLKLTPKEYPRFVVMIGNAPAHAAPSGPTVLPGYLGYGGDPGPDEIMFTGDDLDYVPVINKIASEGITVFTVDYAYSGDAYTSFDYIASQTGGIHYQGTTAWDVSIANEIAARIGPGRGDVVFTCDITGDMSFYFGDVITKTKAIIDTLSTLDVKFGVGTHVDYPDFYTSYGYSAQYGIPQLDYAWSMDTDLTDPATAKSTIDSAIVYGYNGADYPEDYVRALYECQYFSWRARAESYLEFKGTLDDFQLNDYIHNPASTMWHEIWPTQGRSWELTEWLDQLFLSPSDQILLTLKDEVGQPIPGAEAEYHVDKLTVAMNLTSMDSGMEHIVKFEGSLRQFKYYHWMEPLGTQWHEVSPTYCRQWYLYAWDDTGSGKLDYTDYILMVDKKTGAEEWFYVESLSTDMWVTQKICGVDITNVATFHCGSPENAGYPGWTIQVNVTIHNNGTIPINCTVNAYYYNATTTVLIGTQTITNLAPCDTITLTFNWMLPSPCKTYTVKANATCLCGASDQFINGIMKVKLPGDVNGDGNVWPDDLGPLSAAWLSSKGDSNWNPHCDFTDDGNVWPSDLGPLSANWLEGC